MLGSYGSLVMTEYTLQRVKLSGLLRPDGNQGPGAGKPSDTTQGSLAMLHISRLTLRLHKYWENFDLLALVGLVAESVLAAAAGRTLG